MGEDGWRQGDIVVRRALRGALAVVAVLVAYFLLGNPNVNFRSSDSRWSDGEVGFKGRIFENVVFNFEGYKLKCHASKSILVRTTAENWINVFAWPSYFRDRKWRVPYGSEDPRIGSYYPPAYSSNCYNEAWSWEIIRAAEANAHAYLNRL